MMKQIVKFSALLFLLVAIASCEEELQLPDNLVEFESTELGISSSENEMVINISLSRETSEDGALTISMQSDKLVYGEDYVTEPAASSNTLMLEVAKGTSVVSFKVIKVEEALFDGDEQILFTLQSNNKSLVLGEKAEFTLTFAEIIAQHGSMDPNVGGESQPNKVFVDLSANRQSHVTRSDWDLGFYTANGEFKVILNSSSSMLARALNKNDLNNVSAADTSGWSVQFSTDAIFSAILGPPPSWIGEAINWIDSPNGDMNATAIANVSSTDSENKVYIINRGKTPDGSPPGWKKVRVIRSGTGYSVQHADISATTFQTIEVARDEAYLFNYINFDGGPVNIEPKKDAWDIAFTVFTNSTPIGGPSDPVIPYVFLDMILQNRFSVETAEVLTSAVSYESFAEGNIAGVTFDTSQINIGSKWRSGGGPSSGPSLKTDRYYIVKDSGGNVYKLKFTALLQGGERGRPQIQFDLVKKGS